MSEFFCAFMLRRPKKNHQYWTKIISYKLNKKESKTVYFGKRILFGDIHTAGHICFRNKCYRSSTKISDNHYK